MTRVFGFGFDGIVGQREIVEGLINAVRTDRVGHAYIFSGPAGIGKKTAAEAFSSLLLCGRIQESMKAAGSAANEGSDERLKYRLESGSEERVNEDSKYGSKDLKACGTCPACLLHGNGANPDFHVIEAEGSSIGVEVIRKIQGEILVKPMYSKRKVYLITDADKMTVQAQNCLLKTLEEPPGYAVLILTVSNLNLILETIRSRSVRLNFKKNTPEEIRSLLEKKIAGRLADMDFIVSYSDGIPGTAIGIAASDEFRDLRNGTAEAVLRLAKSKTGEVFEIYRFFDANKDSIDTILDIMLLFYRDFLMVKKLQDENVLINSDKKDIILSNAEKFTAEKLFENIRQIEETRRNLKQNANYQLAVEVMLMRLQEEQDGKGGRGKI